MGSRGNVRITTAPPLAWVFSAALEEGWIMKVGTNVFALALLTLVSTWGLSGCSKQESATTTKPDTRNKAAEKADEHDQHAEAKTDGHKGEEQGMHEHHKKDGHKRGEHAKHDHHQQGGHKRGEHKDHKDGERHDKEIAPQVKVGDKVPDFSVRILDGKSVKLSELQEDESRTKKGVVLSFWCTTCHSCRDVEHLLAKLCKDYEGQAAVIALDANAGETAEDVAAFTKKHGLAVPVVLDP